MNIFKQEPRGARFEEGDEVWLIGISREYEDSGLGTARLDLARGLDTPDARHSDVNDSDIGMQSLYSLHSLFAPCGLGDNFYITPPCQHAPRPDAYQSASARQYGAGPP